MTITDARALKDILAQLARQAKINLVFSPSLKGLTERGMNYTAFGQLLIEVIQFLCSLSHLRYRILGKTLYIEDNTPYLFTYTVPFLLGNRKSQSKVSIMTDVFSGVQSKDSSGDNGSDTQLTSGSNTDFWAEVEQNLHMILSRS